MLALNFLFTLASLNLNLKVGVEVKGSKASEELHHAHSEIPPSCEFVASAHAIDIFVIVALVQHSTSTRRQQHHVDYHACQNHLLVEPKVAEK